MYGSGVRFVRASSEDEMIALFLETELTSVRHGSGLRQLLQAHALPERVVVAPDLADPSDNAQRRRLLDMHRGCESRVGLFAGFPRDVRWEWVALSPEKLLSTKYINYDYWRELSGGSRLAADAPAVIRAGVTPFRVSSEWAIHFGETFAAGAQFPPLILVSSAPHMQLVVLEGHARLTAYAMHPDALPSEVEVLLGTSFDMVHWPLY
jgi:hypothetical protein